MRASPFVLAALLLLPAACSSQSPTQPHLPDTPGRVVSTEPLTPQAYTIRVADLPAPYATASARKGRDVFLSGSCVMCHAINGTPAGSRVGPDLTHLASRLTLAAGELPLNLGNLHGWIADPQALKPEPRSDRKRPRSHR